MSKRITLTDFEIEQIISALDRLKNETLLSYEVIKVGQRWYGVLIEKLKRNTDV
jgi:hypothetical protein